MCKSVEPSHMGAREGVKIRNSDPVSIWKVDISLMVHFAFTWVFKNVVLKGYLS